MYYSKYYQHYMGQYKGKSKGIFCASKTLHNIRGTWVRDMRVEVENSNVVGYQVNMQLTFLLDDTLD